MIFVRVLVIFLGASSQAYQLYTQPLKAASVPEILAPKNVTKTKPSSRSFGGGQPKSQQKSFVKGLLQEFDNKAKTTVEKNTYNETKGVEICWKSIIYVNETLGGIVTPWREIKVVFHFPADDKNQSKNEPAGRKKEYRKYGIQSEKGQVTPRDFEVLEKHPMYTISKCENVTCEIGRFLTKTYYDWPEADKQKVVLKLADRNHHQLSEYDEEDFVVSIPKPISMMEDILGSPRTSKIDDDDWSSEEEEEEIIVRRKIQNDIILPVENYVDLEAEISKRPQPFVAKLNNVSGEPLKKTFNQTTDGGYPSESPKVTFERANNETSFENKVIVPSMDSCSPFLTQLLSGNGILPGLCNLKKDEKVILRGDIIISRKYINEVNKTAVEEPMYIIHENSEIEAAMNNETAKKL